MPTVAPQPVAFCPSPWPGRRSAGSSPAQRSSRMRRFSAVTGSFSSSQALASTGRPRIVALRRSLGGVVQLPAVVVVFKLHVAAIAAGRRELLGLVRRQVLAEECNFAAGPLVEVLAEPVEDLGDVGDQPVAVLLQAYPMGAGEELAGLVVQLLVELGAGIGLGADRRAALGGAVDREVDARVVESGPDAVVLDVVQGDRAALRGHSVFLEDVQAHD